jgi:YVTN family beta-propeller protein
MRHRLLTLNRLLLVAIVLCGATEALAQPFLYTAPRLPHVRVLNAATLSEVATIELPASQVPTDVALGSEDRRLYIATGPSAQGSTASGSLVVVDTLTNAIVHTLPLTRGARAVAVSPDGQRVYVARDPSTITIVRTTDFAIVGEVPVGIEPADVVVTPDGSALYVANQGSDNVSVITLATATPSTIPVGSRPVHLAMSPDGRRVYVANNGSASLSVIDTASRMVTDIITIETEQNLPTPGPSGLAFSPDGAKLYVGDARFGTFGQTAPVRVLNTAARTLTATNVFTRGWDIAIHGPTLRAYVFGSTSNTFDTSQLRVIDMTTDTAAGSASLGGSGSGAIAVGNPAGCAFEISPKLAQFGPGGGSGTINVPAPAGCSWTAAASASWVGLSATAGSGPATVTFTVAANGGEPRSATIVIAGQTLVVRQTVPQTWIDEPVDGSTVNQPAVLRGWAIDRDDTQVPGTDGVDVVHVWAYAASGGPPTFLGEASSDDRPDLGAVYGEKYRFAGFRLTVRGLPAGSYTIVAFARSSRTGAFNPKSVSVTLTANSTPAGFVDAPRDGDEVTQPFLLAGWAADLARSSGTGVDAVNVYAYPDGGGAPIFVGAAQYGTWLRADVGSYFQDTALSHTGYIMLVSGLPIGRYQIVTFAHSTVTGEFFARSVSVNVIGSSEAIMQVDVATPQSGNPCCAVLLFGWAVDRRATSGNGIAALHFYAYPDGGAAPVFLGSTGSPATDRDVPELLMGSQFRRSGWHFNTPPIAPGGYRIVVYAQSSVTGAFDAVRVVRVVIP